MREIWISGTAPSARMLLEGLILPHAVGEQHACMSTPSCAHRAPSPALSPALSPDLSQAPGCHTAKVDVVRAIRFERFVRAIRFERFVRAIRFERFVRAIRFERFVRAMRFERFVRAIRFERFVRVIRFERFVRAMRFERFVRAMRFERLMSPPLQVVSGFACSVASRSQAPGY